MNILQSGQTAKGEVPRPLHEVADCAGCAGCACFDHPNENRPAALGEERRGAGWVGVVRPLTSAAPT